MMYHCPISKNSSSNIESQLVMHQLSDASTKSRTFFLRSPNLLEINSYLSKEIDTLQAKLVILDDIRKTVKCLTKKSQNCCKKSSLKGDFTNKERKGNGLEKISKYNFIEIIKKMP